MFGVTSVFSWLAIGSGLYYFESRLSNSSSFLLRPSHFILLSSADTLRTVEYYRYYFLVKLSNSSTFNVCVSFSDCFFHILLSHASHFTLILIRRPYVTDEPIQMELQCVSIPSKGKGMISLTDIPLASLIHKEDPYAAV